MTDEDTLRAAHDSWNEGGFDSFAAYLAPDVVWHAPPEYPEGDAWYGRDAIASAWHAQWDSVFEAYGTEMTEFEQGPDKWFSGQKTIGVAKRSGMHVDSTTYMVGRLEGGLIKELWVFLHRDEARRKAGLEA